MGFDCSSSWSLLTHYFQSMSALPKSHEFSDTEVEATVCHSACIFKSDLFSVRITCASDYGSRGTALQQAMDGNSVSDQSAQTVG